MEIALKSSFRDNAGYLFVENDQLYRRILKPGIADFELFESSGLKDHVTDKGWVLDHEVVERGDSIVIKPEFLRFISYPYEWSFSQYRAAALATLRLQKVALKYGMRLKDASAYNIQFVDGKPVLIDTLSFEKYQEGEPWIAYRQFCQHFLAPLALASYVDVDLLKLMQQYIDGVPLEMARKILPRKTKFNTGLYTHIHLHAKTQNKHAADTESVKKVTGKISAKAMSGLIDHLYNTVKKLSWNPKGTEWGDYYTFTNYSEEGFTAKNELVSSFIDTCAPSGVWDLGANDGRFSQIAADKGIPTVAFDIDPIAVEKNYKRIREQKVKNMLPLRMDLTNPSPSLGWASEERDSLVERGKVDCVMALALIHHISISNNVPLDRVAKFLHSLAKSVIIEFVPKSDSQVKILLATREDIFPLYNEEGFEEAFSQYFTLKMKEEVKGTERTLYLFEAK